MIMNQYQSPNSKVSAPITSWRPSVEPHVDEAGRQGDGQKHVEEQVPQLRPPYPGVGVSPCASRFVWRTYHASRQYVNEDFIKHLTPTFG